MTGKDMIEQETAEPPAIDEDVALFLDGSNPAALIGWAEAQGIEAGAVLLASELARMSEAGQVPFVAAFIAERRSSRDIALRWMLWLWSDAEAPVCARFTDTADREAAELIIDMHRRVLAGETIEAGEWRAARRRFMAAISPSALTAAVDTIVSSMWAMQTTPGAIADAARSWIKQTAEVDALAPADWTAAEHDRVTTIWDEYGIEQARHNRRLRDESDEAYSARMQEYTRDHPLNLTAEDWSHWNAWQDHYRRLTALRTAELRRGLLRIIAS
ncbi:hypothetical protein KY084_14990 [Stakelama sp. CBK3Z-3]|uniref:Uncharacterized protein n=1 Tax=Stakelama flava TaxID=2860338 RepID=A0ABS6XPX3_9SPHN|nr:hypothetical protein [Stakelama flava]MBW4332166.1 hypothetical protein [Stakelama flava]